MLSHLLTMFKKLWNNRQTLDQSELERTYARLELTQTAAGLTAWELDIARDEMTWTAGRPNLVTLGSAIKMRHVDVVAAVHPDDQASTLAAARRAVANKTEFNHEFRVPVPGGTSRWILSRGKLFYDQNGHPVRMLGVNMDITDRKLLEVANTEEKERFRAIFDQTSIGIGYLAFAETFQLANQKLCDMFQYTNDEMRTKRIFDLLDADTHAETRQRRDQFRDSGLSEATGQLLFIRKDGSRFPGEITVSRVFLANAKPLLVAIVRDISIKVEAENAAARAIEDMKIAKRAADGANEAKTHFLANMSHEIRTPLTAILGFTELLSDALAADPLLHKFVDTISRNGQALNQLLGNILDLSKIEANHLDTEQNAADIRSIIQSMQSTLEPQVALRDISFIVRIDDNVPDQLITDAAKLRQILLNVVGNAIKFTHQGSVQVDVRLTDADTAPGTTLKITVTDTGIGMTQLQQTKLFQPFSQGDMSTTRVYGGSGLGLALARRLARLLKGELRCASSAPNEGSQFVLTIPTSADQARPDNDALDNASASLSSSNRNSRLNGAKVLLVEDTPDTQEYLLHCLSMATLEVDLAANGQDALRMALNQDYALILMDIQIPLIDGIEVTRQLRAHGCKTPIIALTAHAMTEDREACFEAGCNAHMTKPISPTKLLDAVDAMLLRST